MKFFGEKVGEKLGERENCVEKILWQKLIKEVGVKSLVENLVDQSFIEKVDGKKKKKNRDIFLEIF